MLFSIIVILLFLVKSLSMLVLLSQSNVLNCCASLCWWLTCLFFLHNAVNSSEVGMW